MMAACLLDFLKSKFNSSLGRALGEDIRKLDYGQHVVAGTPGRVFDMIRRRNLRTRSIKLLVLDEADEMLNKGFKEQIYDVYRYLPPFTQVVLLSATLPHEILEITSKFMTDPIRILVKRDELTLEGKDKHKLPKFQTHFRFLKTKIKFQIIRNTSNNFCLFWI